VSYSQLTQDQRYQIYEMKHEGKTQKQMAKAVGVHPSTISRELQRNQGQRGYRPHQAHAMALERRDIPRRPPTFTGKLRQTVEDKLREDLSPEQISGWLKKHHKPSVSHERIYQHVWEDQAQGGDLHTHLRHAHKKYRKRYGKRDRRGTIPDRVGIEQRPKVVERRSRVGDWELDSVLGRQESQAIVSAVERRSRFTILAKVDQRKAETVGAAVIDALGPHKERVLTLTSDNGREFANHQQIAQGLGAGFYFARPYHSWERGTNENTNGLLRQYIPKKCSLDKIGTEELRFVMERLNHRPRKCLGYKTPDEVFFSGHT